MGKKWRVLTVPRGKNIILKKGGGAKISYLWQIYTPEKWGWERISICRELYTTLSSTIDLRIGTENVKSALCGGDDEGRMDDGSTTHGGRAFVQLKCKSRNKDGNNFGENSCLTFTQMLNLSF